MKVGSGSSAAPRHTGAAPLFLLFRSPPLGTGGGAGGRGRRLRLLFLFRGAREKEGTRGTAKWDIRNILESTARPRIGRQVSWSPFSLFLSSLLP